MPWLFASAGVSGRAPTACLPEIIKFTSIYHSIYAASLNEISLGVLHCREETEREKTFDEIDEETEREASYVLIIAGIHLNFGKESFVRCSWSIFTRANQAKQSRNYQAFKFARALSRMLLGLFAVIGRPPDFLYINIFVEEWKKTKIFQPGSSLE